MSDLDDIARRLVAHPRWEWRDGMLAVDGFGHRVRCRGPGGFDPPWTLRPDLTDPATAGVLLAMLGAVVQHERDDTTETLVTMHGGGGFSVAIQRWPEEDDEIAPIILVTADTLGEAVAIALLDVL